MSRVAYDIVVRVEEYYEGAALGGLHAMALCALAALDEAMRDRPVTCSIQGAWRVHLDDAGKGTPE